jgi:hypothetical protein
VLGPDGFALAQVGYRAGDHVGHFLKKPVSKTVSIQFNCLSHQGYFTLNIRKIQELLEKTEKSSNR